MEFSCRVLELRAWCACAMYTTIYRASDGPTVGAKGTWVHMMNTGAIEFPSPRPVTGSIVMAGVMGCKYPILHPAPQE